MLFLEFVVLVLVKILRNSDNNALTVFTFPSGQSSHFTTSSEKLAKTINDFVDAGGIAEQHPQLVRDGLRIRDFNATLIHCSLYNINSSLAPALHETPVLCPVSLITVGSVAGGAQDYNMSSLSKYQKHLDGRPSSICMNAKPRVAGVWRRGNPYAFWERIPPTKVLPERSRSSTQLAVRFLRLGKATRRSRSS